MRNSLMLSVGLILVLGTLAAGQITITNNFQPDVGTVFQYHNDVNVDSAFYASLTSGDNGPMLWDFTDRVYDTGYFSYVVSLASTPDIDSFPDANLVFQNPTDVDTVWVLYQNQPRIFTREGTVTRGSGDAVVVYRNNAADWVFPVDYNNEWTGYHHWTEYSPETYTEITDTIFNAADAWGTAQYQSFLFPCLRVMAHERFIYNTYDYTDSLLDSNFTDLYTASFVDSNFNILVTTSRTIVESFSSYTSYASSRFLEGITDVAESDNLPVSNQLEQNYPNPFNATTSIQYDLPVASDVTLEVFDILGRKVETLVDGEQDAGHHTAFWDGQLRSSGMYFYRLQAENYAETRRMLLLK